MAYHYPGAIPGQPPVQDPLWGYFSSVAGQDGQIDAGELQRCLTQSGIGGTYQPFNLETCMLMINMLDQDHSGSMGFSEFKELWAALSQWKTCFMGYDRDRSGSVDAQELKQALTSFGYNLSPQALGVIMKRYSSAGKIVFDSFVGICVRMRLITTQFQAHDTMRNGTATFRYDDFVQVVMSS